MICAETSSWPWLRVRLSLAVGSFWIGCALPAESSLKSPEVEGSARGFPVLRDLGGRRLAEGEFTQWFERDRLHIGNSYDFGGNHRIEERAVFRIQPLVQEAWSWREFAHGSLLRAYSVDLTTGEAQARKQEKGDVESWQERLDIEAGRTFAGIGFTTAIRSLRDRLLNGETIELRAVGFTPRPRLVTVRISHEGVDRMLMSGRRISGDRFLIRPKIPAVAKFLFDAPDTLIWLTYPAPAGFLRWEGPLAEPGDPIVRADLLPGDPSGPAEPTRTRSVAPTGP